MAETGTWKCFTCGSLFASGALHRKHRPNGYCIFVVQGAAPAAAPAHPPAPAAAQHLIAAAPPAARRG